MLSTIAKPFGMLLLWLYETFQNYGVAVILFALIVKIVLLPFMAKSKKSTMRSARLTPKIQELQKRHGANKQKYSEEVQKLYREENINPMSGCLWSLLPFPILIALYEAIRYPITTMMGVSKDLIAEGGALHTFLYDTLGFETSLSAAYSQIAESQFITANWEQYKDQFLAISDKLTNIEWSFLGLDLGARPDWKFFLTADFSDPSSWLPQFGLFMIPILAAVVQYFASKVTRSMTPSQPGNEQAEMQMQMMSFMMPFMTIWFAFMMPAALGVYWIANSGFSMIQDIILTKTYKKQMDAEDAERREREKQREAELESKRLETEKLRASNSTEVNPNTSKRKKHRKERLEQEEKSAEWEKTHHHRKRHKSEANKEDNPSRVGNRPYARGRAYDPNRFGPAVEDMEEATIAEIEQTEISETIAENISAEAPVNEDILLSEDTENEYDEAEDEYDLDKEEN